MIIWYKWIRKHGSQKNKYLIKFTFIGSRFLLKYHRPEVHSVTRFVLQVMTTQDEIDVVFGSVPGPIIHEVDVATPSEDCLSAPQ